MKRKFSTPDSPFLNVLIALICVIGIGASLVFFWLDLDNTRKQLEEKPVGTVYWMNNNVQRFSSRYRQWERLQRHSPIYDGDLISSAGISDVKISFINGEILDLLENTQVEIQYTNEEIPVFEIQKGTIEVQSDRMNLEISAAQSAAFMVNLEPKASAALSMGEDGSVFKLFQGSGTLSAGETRPLETGDAFTVGNDDAMPEDLSLIMLSPRDGMKILRASPGTEPVKFLWHKLSSAEESPVRLEIAESADFSVPAGAGTWDISGDTIDIDLAEGMYYWRIYASYPGIPADSGRLNIVHAGGPRPISPSDGSILAHSDGNDMRFSWAIPEEAEAVLLEVAANPEMNRPRIRQLVKRTDGGYGSYIASGLGTGRWYWRIHPVYPGGMSGGDSLFSSPGSGQGFWRVRPVNAYVIAEDLPSEINSFMLVDPAELPAPEIPSKELNILNIAEGNVPRLVFPPDNYTLEAGRTPDIFFQWINPPSYKARLQISERNDFLGTFVVDEAAFGSGIRGSYLKPGTYYWRVVAAGGGESPPPARLVITADLTAPTLSAPKENDNLLVTATDPVKFSWGRAGYATHYLFRIFLEGRAAPITEINDINSTELEMYFDPRTQGRFTWTVQGIASPTDTFSGREGLIAKGRFTMGPLDGASRPDAIGWMNPRIGDIIISPSEYYSPIVLLTPRNNQTISGIEALRSPGLARWRMEEPLTKVQLRVSKSQNPTEEAYVVDVEDSASSIAFPPLSPGEWYWTIRGDTLEGLGALPARAFKLNVAAIPQLDPPQIREPVNETVIGLARLTSDRKVTFSWDEVAGANAYIFSLFWLPPDETRPRVMRIIAPPTQNTSYVLENLTLLNSFGTYVWQVEAIHRNEQGAIDQEGDIVEHRFTVVQEEERTGSRPIDPGRIVGN